MLVLGTEWYKNDTDCRTTLIKNNKQGAVIKKQNEN